MIAVLLGAVLVGFLVVLIFGLVTGRIDWRQQGCCDANPANDGRMYAPEDRVA
ncbi:MAG: hypothetical protein M0Z98_07425 [Actinomycetales bacterium]|nr:hypothetical protein [Actinomycetales bacterium]